MQIIKKIDQLGTVGLFSTMIISFVIAELEGVNFKFLNSNSIWLLMILVLIIITGLFLSYRKHRCTYPLLIGIPGAVLILYDNISDKSSFGSFFLMAGLFGILTSVIWNNRRNKLHGNFDSCSGK
jgi:FtsH-binding integral membrane protein